MTNNQTVIIIKENINGDKAMNYPVWLSFEELEQAQVLIEQGFYFCGNADDFDVSSVFNIVGTWKLCTGAGEPTLDCICNGALYVRESKSYNMIQFKKELNHVKKILKEKIKEQINKKPKQLSFL